jgi:Fe-S-cluster containining protein
MSKSLQLSVSEFTSLYVERPVGSSGTWFELKSRNVIDEESKDLEPCALLSPDSKCTVYDARPTQCRYCGQIFCLRCCVAFACGIYDGTPL